MPKVEKLILRFFKVDFLVKIVKFTPLEWLTIRIQQ